MKEIKIEKLESLITYGNYTAFVYDDGMQVMYSGGTINEDTIAPYEDGVIELYEMDELPIIKDLMQDNLLAEFAHIKEEYESLRDFFANGNGYIAKVESGRTNIYMLIV